jgi:2-dehydropantoate 2-reductase
MRILMVGAGALGGYFGGRLLEAKRDVTFLVRPRRAGELKKNGLIIKSPVGDATLPTPPHLLAEEIQTPFDVVIVASKAYGLADTMESFAPAVGPETAVLPLLNGMLHIDRLSERFGSGAVLGGLCMISAVLDPSGVVVHLNDKHGLVFGERDGSTSPRVEAITSAFAGANFHSRPSTKILQDMWEKWVFIAAGAGITCLMRAAIGDIVAAGAAGLASKLLDECAAIAAKEGFPPSLASTERSRAMLTEPGSLLTASMLRDMERGAPTEADHIIGDLLRRGDRESSPLLSSAYAHLKSYEMRQARQALATS